MRCKFSWHHAFIGGVAILILMAVGEIRLHGQNADAVATVSGDSPSYIFQLQLDGATVAGYTECLGLGSANDVLENEMVTDSGKIVTVKTPGALRWYNIVLRRTGVIDETVWAWRRATQDGNTERAFRDGAIIMRTAEGNSQVAKWTFERGWAASLKLDDSVEELMIVHEGLKYDTTSGGNRRK